MSNVFQTLVKPVQTQRVGPSIVVGLTFVRIPLSVSTSVGECRRLQSAPTDQQARQRVVVLPRFVEGDSEEVGFDDGNTVQVRIVNQITHNNHNF